VHVFFLAAAALAVCAGCQGPGSGKTLLSVDFEPGRELRYKFISERDIKVNWGSVKKAGGASKDKIDKLSEQLSMVVSYRPVEVNPYGVTVVEAKCESVKTNRGSLTGRRLVQKDAAETAAGKSFRLSVGPTGRIEDYSDLARLIRQTGEKAFRAGSGRGRIKEPDMIGDFVATQWFLWDAVSSIEDPVKGVSAGQSWKSVLSVPVPMVMRAARDVRYELKEIRPTEAGTMAVIGSEYSLCEDAPKTWPLPYTGSFEMSGLFGFLRSYKLLDLAGEGEELFNIDAGRIERYRQQYRAEFEASMMLPLGSKPRLTIEQELRMELLPD